MTRQPTIHSSHSFHIPRTDLRIMFVALGSDQIVINNQNRSLTMRCVVSIVYTRHTEINSKQASMRHTEI